MKKIFYWLKEYSFLSWNRKELLKEYGTKLIVWDLMQIKALVQLQKQWAKGIIVVIFLFFTMVDMLRCGEILYYLLFPEVKVIKS